MATVVAGVAVSGGRACGYDRLARASHMPLSVLAIYAALALVYLAGSRFIVRYLVYYKRNGRRGQVRGDLRGRGGRRATFLGAARWPGLSRRWPLSTTNAPCTAAASTASRYYGREALPTAHSAISISSGCCLPSPPPRSAASRKSCACWSRSAFTCSRCRICRTSSPALAHIDELRDVDVADLLGRDAVPPIRGSLPRAFAANRSW